MFHDKHYLVSEIDRINYSLSTSNFSGMIKRACIPGQDSK